MKKYLFPALAIAMTFMVMVAFEQAKPTPKAPVYQEVKKYSPYYIDKRFGGLQIMSKSDENFKEKPNNMEVFHRLESLEKEWGKTHLKLLKRNLLITDDNGTEVATVPLSNSKDREFIQIYYGVE